MGVKTVVNTPQAIGPRYCLPYGWLLPRRLWGIAHKEMAMMPSALELVLNGKEKWLCGWLQPLWEVAMEVVKGCKDLWGIFGGD